MDELPIGKFYGVGKITEKKMHQLGLYYGKNLKKRNGIELEKYFGKNGLFYYEITKGIDNRPVMEFSKRKSLGIEDTFQIDIDDKKILVEFLKDLTTMLLERMESKDLRGKSLSIKIKYSDFRLKTMTTNYPNYIGEEQEIQNLAYELFDRVWQGEGKLGLLGYTLSNLDKDINDGHISLFS